MAILTKNWRVEAITAERVQVTLNDGREDKMMEMGCSVSQFMRGAERVFTHNQLIQNAFPFLNANEREFLMTGLTPEEWDAIFSDEEEA